MNQDVTVVMVCGGVLIIWIAVFCLFMKTR